jgi:hypothetical protein
LTPYRNNQDKTEIRSTKYETNSKFTFSNDRNGRQHGLKPILLVLDSCLRRNDGLIIWKCGLGVNGKFVGEWLIGEWVVVDGGA